MRTIVRPAVLLAVLAGLPSVASATTLTFDTSDSAFAPPVANQGWWSATAPNDSDNDNYFTGLLSGADRRSFFTFDLSGLDLSGVAIVSATLELARYSSAVVPNPLTIEFFDVATAPLTLNNNTGANPAIYDDLGTGTSYGSFDVVGDATSSLLTLSFVLNDAALTDIALASGGFFSIGGALQTSGYLFGSSGRNGVQQLILETAPIPEPSSLALLGTGLLAGACRRRRR